MLVAFGIGFFVLGLIAWIACVMLKDRAGENGKFICGFIGTILFMISCIFWFSRGFYFGNGFLGDETKLWRDNIYQVVGEIKKSSIGGNKVLIVRSLCKRDLETGDLVWGPYLYIDFKNIPPMPCFRITNADGIKYEKVEIVDVESNPVSE